MDTGATQPARLSREREASLVRRWLQGDDEACRILRAAHHPGLVAYVRKRICTAPHLEAEDVCQDVWVYVHRNLHVYDEAYEFGQFLFGLAMNIVRRALSPHDRLVPVGSAEDLPERQAATGRRRRPDDGPKPDPEWFSYIEDRAEALKPGEAALYREIFELIFRCGGYPHQTISFCYSTMVYGQAKRGDSGVGGRAPARVKNLVTGNPRQVVREHSNHSLGLLGSTLVRFAGAGQGWSEEVENEVSAPLNERLRLRGGELFARDRVSQNLFASLREAVVAETILKEYYGSDPVKSVTDWTNAVKKRVRARLEGTASCRRCVLPCREHHENSDQTPVDGAGGGGSDHLEENRMTAIHGHATQEQLLCFSRGELDGDQAVEMFSHLAECDRCCRRLRALKAIGQDFDLHWESMLKRTRDLAETHPLELLGKAAAAPATSPGMFQVATRIIMDAAHQIVGVATQGVRGLMSDPGAYAFALRPRYAGVAGPSTAVRAGELIDEAAALLAAEQAAEAMACLERAALADPGSVDDAQLTISSAREPGEINVHLNAGQRIINVLRAPGPGDDETWVATLLGPGGQVLVETPLEVVPGAPYHLAEFRGIADGEYIVAVRRL